MNDDTSTMQIIENQVVLVTGATDGLGKHVARDLAERGATVLLHGRNQEKGRATRQELHDATGNDTLTYYNADFASLDAVGRLAQEIQADHEQLDVLINNVGIGVRSQDAPREESADGYERRFAVNYLTHFLLTRRLLPLLRSSSLARIVNVSSVLQQAINFDDVMLEDEYDEFRAYSQSKLAQVMFTFDLATEIAENGVTVNALHPAALMNTNMVHESEFFSNTESTVEDGAEAVEYLATSADLDGVTGAYYEGTQRADANSQARDTAARRQLRELSERLTGLSEIDSPLAASEEATQ